MSIELVSIIFIFIVGIILGSFYNVVGYRLPNNMSIVFPNSHCTNCNHELKFYELIPILSYLFLKGKCMKCNKKISIIYPVFEFITGILFLLSYLVFGFSIEFIIAVTFISILIIITVSDIKYYIIPDEVLLIGSLLLVVEFFINCVINKISLVNGLFMPLLNGLGAFSLLYLFKILGDFIFKKESLGGGDIKLLFVIGLVLGFDMSVVAIFIAAFIALPLSVISLIKDDNNVLPFGPYLSIASVIILLMQLDLDKILNLFIK